MVRTASESAQGCAALSHIAPVTYSPRSATLSASRDARKTPLVQSHSVDSSQNQSQYDKGKMSFNVGLSLSDTASETTTGPRSPSSTLYVRDDAANTPVATPEVWNADEAVLVTGGAGASWGPTSPNTSSEEARRFW